MKPLHFCLVPLLLAAPALAFETNVLVRDPSTIVKRGDTYWVYGTGIGTQQFSSTDRMHWTKQGPALPNAPAWVAEKVPGNKDNTVWAPDVHFFNGQYYLYFSYSAMGSRNSGIGVATSATLDPRSWVDQGLVVATGGPESFNAIDPCIFEDAEGRPWLAFGSYFSGIRLMRIDPKTGKQAKDDAKIYDLATRPGVPGNAIEASAVYYHDGYYYLFVNWDACCAGSKSSYNIRMGRSKSVTGPYLDKSGNDMNQGGGTLFLCALYDNGSGRLFDDQVGPGHVGILKDTDGYWLSTHYEWARAQHGATTMNLNKLDWDADGWPRAVLDPGPYRIVSNLTTHDLVTVVGGATSDGSPLHTWPYEGGNAQLWSLAYQGEGYYSIIGVASNKALGAVGCAANPGAKVEIAPFQKRDCQLWYLQQHDDGTYSLLTKNSGKAVALDVGGCRIEDGTPIGLWTATGADCQKWSFRIH